MKWKKQTPILLLLLAAALVAAPVSGLLAGTETQVTTNESIQFFPAIWDDRIVWGDGRNIDPVSPVENVDIYMYTIGTGDETQVTTNESEQSSPAIWGDRIVWEDNRNGNWDIYLYNISTGDETQVTFDESEQSSPAIWGDRIVWEDYRNGDCDIYLYNISTGAETQVTTNEYHQYRPAIWGDLIVWEDYRACDPPYYFDGNVDIYLYNLSTTMETQVTLDESEQSSPAIWGDRIVWEDYRNGNRDIYLYDLSTGIETRVTLDTSNQYDPAIYGDRIVWIDSRNVSTSSLDLYLYDLSTTMETQVITNEDEQSSPAIWGDRIVWMDSRNDNYDNNYDIYMFEIDTTSVNNPPTDAVIVTPSDPIPVNVNCTANVTFTDPDLGKGGESHAVTWDWGDGSPCVDVPAVGNHCECEHPYQEAGIYQVRATVTDAAGAECEAVSDYIVVYDPDGGFVTGGGWFWSPPGAYVADDDLEGKATFGFVSRYLKKAEVPTGNTEFHFQVADLNFHSDAYDWLVVAGTKAMFKGTGTINGEGSYKFMISATDGDPDMFRIRIWEEEEEDELVATDAVEESVIYDNQLSNDDMENDDTGTVIEGGSIVVKKK